MHSLKTKPKNAMRQSFRLNAKVVHTMSQKVFGPFSKQRCKSKTTKNINIAEYRGSTTWRKVLRSEKKVNLRKYLAHFLVERNKTN